MADRTDNLTSGNLLGIPETLLPDDFIDLQVTEELSDGEPRDIAARHPESPMVWATLAQDALTDGDEIAAYAYARTGYHRGLDALRQAGWRGQGPIPASHAPNRGFLRALAMLGETSRRLGDDAEADRVTAFLREADPSLLG
ncbi:hypothetical protein BH708_18265 [Brachybacterium sp. P6-10-X1]|uniref:DUF3151 domain-containing protein n=1 Tax=Brachybacterium sp. P6-10-X1 TaxID=1903186 RepID=UPI0009718D80|nr:DUF3151 domain-containing protein [Brachybacterium sp. P6-10-X1]APX34329.1 hypothetical protein BH708_18265 [Brachybacterium sp. P6-10-X1]